MHRRAEAVLAAILALEVALFSLTGTNFFTRGNFFEIQRLGVELGLLALAMTPVIVTGGIDLSVGSLMALSAALMGMMWGVAGGRVRRRRLASGCIAAPPGARLPVPLHECSSTPP